MTESRQTYYEILGIEDDADTEKINERYYNQLHRIKHMTGNNVDYERKIHQAHMTLTDLKQKQAYDLGLKHGQSEGTKDTHKNSKNRIEPYEKIKI